MFDKDMLFYQHFIICIPFALYLVYIWLGLLFLRTVMYSFIGNEHLNEAIAEHMDELNLAWIGAYPGVKVRSNPLVLAD